MTTGPGLPTVPLPESGDGSRSGRRPAPRKRRERRGPSRTFWWVLAIVVLLAAIAAVVVSMARSDSGGDASTPSTTAPAGELAGETLLLLEKDASGVLVAATLFVVGPDGAGGDVVYVPPGTLAEVPSLGLSALRDAARDGGDAVVQQALENLFGQPLPTVVSLDPAALTEAVAPAGVLTIVLPAPVERRDPSGRVEVLFDDGEVAVTPDEVPSLLEAPGETDLDRLVRHQAFWDGWFAAIATADDALPASEELGPVLAAMAGAEVAHRLLPVQAVASGADLYQVDRAGLADLLGEVLPGATPPGDRIRVQILNGTGEPGLAQQVQPLLVPAGADVVLTGNADRFDHPVTQIVFYDDADEASAQRIREVLGLGEVVRSRTALDVVDVTVVVGADFLSRPTGTPSTSTPGA